MSCTKPLTALRRIPLSRLSPRRFTTSSLLAADHVRIVEVGPRDGLQNEKKSIQLETKIELIERLAQTGLTTIEAAAFVSPKWVPQMANSTDMLDHILREPPPSDHAITYQFLLPNKKGLDSFFSVQDKVSKKSGSSTSSSYPTPPPSPGANNSAGTPLEISIFTAATEAFTQKNTNCSIAESLERFKPVISASKEHGIRVRAYISVALGCPFEGPDVNPHDVASLAASLLEMGADEISVADTTGMGTAPKTGELLKTLKQAGIRTEDIALHFHDTWGQALVNTCVGLEMGVRTFDASVGGLGGCPFSPGATGNVATEDMVHLFHSLGLETGVDIHKLAETGEWISKELDRPNESRAGKAMLAKMRKEMT